MGFKKAKIHEHWEASHPLTPPGALKQAPGPHAVMEEGSACFACYALQLFPFFSQQPSGISALCWSRLKEGEGNLKCTMPSWLCNPQMFADHHCTPSSYVITIFTIIPLLTSYRRVTQSAILISSQPSDFHNFFFFLGGGTFLGDDYSVPIGDRVRWGGGGQSQMRGNLKIVCLGQKCPL